MSIEEMLVRVDATTEALRRELKRGGDSVDRFEKRTKKQLGGIDRQFARLGKSAKAGIAGFVAAVTADATFSGLKSAFDSLENIANQADKIGVTTSSLQELRFAAAETGVSVGTADMAFQRFGRRVAEARQGAGELKGTLDLLNIPLRDSDGTARSLEQVLGDLADATRAQTNEQDKLRIAFKAFDSEGAELVRLLNQGRDGIGDYITEARNLGVVMEDDLVRNAAKVNRDFDRMAFILGVKVKGAVVEAALALDRAFGSGKFDIEDRLNALAAAQRQLEAAQDPNNRPIAQRLLNPGETSRTQAVEAERAREAIAQLSEEIDKYFMVSARNVDTELLSEAQLQRLEEARIKTKELAELRELDLTVSAVDRDTGAIEDIARDTEAAKAELEKIKIAALNAAGEVEQVLKREAEAQVEYVRELQEQGLVTAEESAEAIRDVYGALENNLENVQREADGVSQALQTAFQSAILDARSLDDVIASLGKRLLSIALFGNSGSGGLFGGALTSIGNSVSGFFGGIFGRRAMGGQATAGMPYEVGERGKEVFVPQVSGRILANNELNGGPQIVNHFSFSNVTADDVARIEARTISTMVPVIRTTIDGRLSAIGKPSA